MRIPESGTAPPGAPKPEDLRLPQLLQPAHLTGIAAFALSLGLLFLAPGYAVVPLLGFLLVCLVMPLFPRLSFYLPIVSRGGKDVPGVALTFDDGPDPEVTPRVLDLLERHGIKATFFVIGAKAQRHPELIRAILERGHALGNHSQTHPPFLMLQGRRALAREVATAQAVLRQAGVLARAFRPPVGVTNPDLRAVLAAHGMFCVNFSCRAGDMGNLRVPGLARKLIRKARAGDIILLHDTRPHRVPVDTLLAEFSDLIQGLGRRGLAILPLAEVIGREVMTGPAPPRPD